MTGQIVELLSAIGAEVGAVGKQGRNEQQNYAFRGIDHIMNAAAQAFHKHKVVVSSAWMDVQEDAVESAKGAKGYRVTGRISFTFTAPDGSTIVCVTRGEAIDYGDKATNKAHSAAKKYALVDVLSLPTDEPDADEFSHDLAPSKPRSQRPATGSPMDCPDCGEAVWDNRADNDKREERGEKRRPDFKCRKCEWIQWNADTPVKDDYEPFEPDDSVPGFGAPVVQDPDDQMAAPF